MACLLYIALAIGSGLDRLSEVSPSLAGRVPALFAARAWAVRGRAAVLAGQSEQALEAGRAALLAGPIEPENSAILGISLMRRGDALGAQRAFAVAGQMGWRVPLTQEFWMRQALAMGDYPVAVMRLDALLRQQPDLAENSILLQPFENDDLARKALLQRLASAPLWLESFARPDAERPSPEALTRRARTLDELSATGLQLGCNAIAPMVNSLSKVGAVRQAGSLWRRHCPDAGPGLIADGDLAHVRLDEARSPFEWALIGNSDVELDIMPDAGGRGNDLVIRSTALMPRTVLRQMIVAPAGAYRASWRSVDAAGRPAAGISVMAGCGITSGSPVQPVIDHSGGRVQAVLQLSPACAGHWLEFAVQPGAGEIRLSAIRLDRASAP